MKKAVVLYKNDTGTTQRYGEAIGKYLQAQGFNSLVASIDNFNIEQLQEADHIFLGSPTKGLMLLNQSPDKEWISFARNLPQLNGSNVHLFTTYSIFRGNVFRKMKNHLVDKTTNVKILFKSKTGMLSRLDKNLINVFVN